MRAVPARYSNRNDLSSNIMIPPRRRASALRVWFSRGLRPLPLALGASPRHIARLVLGRGLSFAGWGVGLGLAGAAALTRFLQSLLFGVKPLDPITFGAGPVILAIVAAAAVYGPARRAASIDPLRSLRSE